MKLRLPNKLIAAILAAATPALFSTLSTATLGAAAVATLSQQAVAFTPPAGVEYTGTATVTTTTLEQTLTQNTAISVEDAVQESSGNIVLNASGYDIKITGAGNNDMLDLGKVTANSVWFANGRFRINEAAGDDHIFNGVSTVYVGGSQLWFTDNADYTGAKAISSNFVLGNANISEGYSALDYSALRIAKNTEITGSVTIDAEGSKIAFQGGGNLTFSGALRGTGNLKFDLFDNASTFSLLGDSSGYTGSFNVVNDKITLNFGGGTTEENRTHALHGLSSGGTVSIGEHTTLKLVGDSSLGGRTNGAGKIVVGEQATLTVNNNATLGHAGGTEVTNGATLSLGTGVTLSSGISNADGGVVNVAGTLTNAGANSDFSSASLTLTSPVKIGGAYNYLGLIGNKASGNGTANSALFFGVLTGVTEEGVNGMTVSIDGNAATTDFCNGTLGVKTNAGSYYFVNNTATFNNAATFNNTAGVVVQNDATMTLVGNANGSGANGMIHGVALVKSGATLNLDTKQIMGTSGTNVNQLIIEDGASVVLRHNANESFAGGVALSGSLLSTGAATWEMRDGSSFTVAAGQQATLSTFGLSLLGNDTIFDVGSLATLNVSSAISKANESNGVLVKSGEGALNLTGSLAGISALSLQGGTLTLNHDITLNATNAVKGSGNLHILGGTTRMGGNNSAFTGNILVSGPGAQLKMMGNDQGLGATNRDNTALRTIKAEYGGVIDVNGQNDWQTNNYVFTLGEGGKLVNTGNNLGDGTRQLRHLKVDGSRAVVYVGGTNTFGLLDSGWHTSYLDLNGNTLEKVDDNIFMLVNTTVNGGGTIRLTQGTVQVTKSEVRASNVNFEFNGGSLELKHNLTAGGLTMSGGYTGNGTISGGSALTLALGNNAANTYRGTLAIGNLTVNGGQNRTQTLNLTGASTAGNISVTGGANMVLTSDNGAVLSAGQTTVNNSDSSFLIDGVQLNLSSKMQVSASGQTGHFTMTSGGLKATNINLWRQATVDVTGGSLEFTDAAGFTYDHSGGGNKSTTNLGRNASGVLSADGAVVLKATSNDWSIKLANDAILNLGNVTIDSDNTHNITLQSADGSSSGTLNLYGTVTNNAQFTLGGTLNVLGDGMTVYDIGTSADTNHFVQKNQQWTLVKGGEGATTTLAAGTTATHATLGTLSLNNTDNTVTASTTKVDSTIYYVGVDGTTYNADFASASTGATGFYVGAGKTFNVTGDNLDARSIILGQGATLKTTTGSDFGHRQISGMTLDGDATVNAQANIGIIAASYDAAKLNLNGHTLTVTGSGTFAMINTTADAGTIYLDGGTLQAGHGDKQTTISATETLLKFNAGTVRLSKGSTLKAEGLTGTGSIVREGTATPNLELEPTRSDSPYTFTGSLGDFSMNVTMQATSTGEQQFNLTSASTLGSLTVNGGKLTFGGTSALTAGAATLGNAALAFNTTSNLSEIIATANTTSTLSGTGAISLSTGTNDHGLQVNTGATVNVVTSNLTIANGALFDKGGTLNIGNGADATLVKAKWLVFGNVNNGGTSQLNIKRNATVAVSGGDTNSSHATGIMFSEWGNRSTATIAGNLLAQNATFKGGDSAFRLNIENGGILATKGVASNQSGSVVNLKDGGKLILGGTTTNTNSIVTAQAGSVIGISSDTASFNTDVMLSGVNGKAVTIDTKKYAFNADGTAIAQADAATGGTLTISGNLSGDGALTVIGNGALVLSGNNTYTGATTVTGGSVTYSNAFHGSALNLSGDGTTVTFNGLASSFSGNIAASGAGTLNVGGTAALTANTITITKGTKLNFAQKVTLTSNSRPSFLFDATAATYEGTEVNFNGGYAYTGAGNDGGYAMVVGKKVSVSLGGTSDLTGKNIGLHQGATLKLLDNATLTVQRIYNSSTFDSNGDVNLGSSASLTVTSGANSIVNLGLGSGSTANFSGGATTIGTLSIGSGEATLKHGTNAVTANATNLQDGETLNVFYSETSGAVSLGAVALESGAATIKTTNHGGELNIASLSGTGTLTLAAASASSVHTKFNIGSSANTETQFNGTLVLEQANSTGGERTVTWLLKDDKTAAGADIQMKHTAAGTNTVNAKLALGAESVAVKSISDTGTGTAVFHIAKDSSVTAAGATLNITGDGNATTAATVDAGVNLAMSGTGTQSFSGNMENFSGSIAATQGTLQFLQQATAVNVENLTITGQDATHRAEVGVYSTATKDTAHEAGISVSGTLTANQHATLNANLIMKGGSTIDVDYANGGLTMGSTVTFAGGDKMNLSTDIINGLNSLTIGEGLTLFSGVDAFTINGAAYDVNTTYTASDYFNLAGVTTASDFVIKYGNGGIAALSDGTDQSGQSIFIYREMPEPATATLSLLALAALAARRKRK